MIRHQVSYSWSPDLMEEMALLSAFNWTFTITEESVFRASGHIDYTHRGIAGTANKAIFVAHQLKINGAWVVGSKTGINIVGTEDHYAVLPVHANEVLQPGTYSITVHARSASTAAPGVNGLAEVKGTYNEVVYEVYPT